MDNIISSYNTFNPEKYTMPKFGTEEKIYFWKYDNESQLVLMIKKSNIIYIFVMKIYTVYK